MAGILAGDLGKWPAGASLPGAGVLLLLSVWRGRRCESVSWLQVVLMMLAVASAGAARWAIRREILTAPGVAGLLNDRVLNSDAPVRMTGQCVSIPSKRVLPDRPGRSVEDPAIQTAFLFEAAGLHGSGGAMEASGRCRVLVDGDATRHVHWGDILELTGFVTRPPEPQNPGEYNYREYLERQGIAAIAYVRHPEAIRVTGPVRLPDVRGALNALRQQTVTLLEQQLTRSSQAIAEALLLGNRGHMSPDVERDFIASGTMHLLAISGLHVGILYVFLVRVLNVLLVPRIPALMTAGLFCVLYAFLTDLRPSVLRATLFILLLITAQILRREVRMGSLIGLTTLVLVIVDPAIVFDRGAWLSFLAVGALGWVSYRTPPPREEPAPPEHVTWRDTLRAQVAQAGTWLADGYRRMLAITLLSAPVIAQQFHVVTVAGMVLNVVLIPYTAAVLISGYVFVGLGHLMPFASALLSLPFEYGLKGMNRAVEFVSEMPLGFVMIPDLPWWFLPVFYGLLAGSAVARRGVWRRAYRIALSAFVLVQFHLVCRPPAVTETCCTVLSVGHGNAVLVESPKLGVVLFDAGAMNRSERAADVISRCLWSRGHRMINAVVVSHADSDHYNALQPLLQMVPVGQIITTRQFIDSPAPQVQELLHRVERLGVPVMLAFSGDRAGLPGCEPDVRFLQAAGDRATADDNGSSLVAILGTPHAEFCLPGDLDGAGQRELLPLLHRVPAGGSSDRAPVRIVVAPHHGSLDSNPPEFAAAVDADVVIISSRDNVDEEAIRAIYAPADVWFTAHSGAVTIRGGDAGSPEVETFVKRPVNGQQHRDDVRDR